jgi:hypothetical protein
MRRRGLIAALVALAILGVAVAAALATSMAPPPSATVKTRGLTARTTLGKACDAGHVCTRELRSPRRTKGAFPAPASSRVGIGLDRAAKAVRARLVRGQFEFVGPELIAARTDDEGHRWKVRLPADLEGATRLYIEADYGGGEAYFWAGLKPVASWPRGAGDRPGRRALFLTLHRLRARAVIGTSCLPGGTSNPPSVACSDSAYPLDPRGHPPATPNARAEIDLSKKATSVEASLVRPKDEGNGGDSVGPRLVATPKNDRERSWHLQLPDDLHGATVLDIDVDYVDGSANYWAGIEPVSSWP